MTVTNSWLWTHLRCPDCRRGGLRASDERVTCSHCGARYPCPGGVPALLRADNALFPRAAFEDSSSLSPGDRGLAAKLGRLLPRISVNLSNRRCLERFAAHLGGRTARVLVVGGGTQRTWLDERFAGHPNVELVYTDIDKASLVDCFCDAHDLPFEDACFDGVITTAVLMHVLYPEKAASEIHRVLKPSGLLYSEIGFMQQVIEGAYDFTRYSLSGHRRLFNQFNELEAGMVAGPATALSWALENFVLTFISASFLRLAAKAVFRLSAFWLKYLDYLFQHWPQAMDGASCTYFLGEKIDSAISDAAIIERYVGRKHLQHV